MEKRKKKGKTPVEPVICTVCGKEIKLGDIGVFELGSPTRTVRHAECEPKK
jgi:hypothetical protein